MRLELLVHLLVWSVLFILFFRVPIGRFVQDCTTLCKQTNPQNNLQGNGQINSNCWDYLLSLRVPIISALILLIFPVIATHPWFNLDKFLKNLFVMVNEGQLIMVMCMVSLTSITIISVFKTITILKDTSLNTKEKENFIEGIQWVLFSLLLISPSFWVLRNLNVNDLNNLNKSNFEAAFCQGIFYSGLICLLILVFNYLYSRKVVCNKSLKLTNFLTTLTIFVIEFIVYIVSISLNFPDGKPFTAQKIQAPTLVYALLIIGIMTLLFGGITYYWGLYFEELKDPSSNEEIESNIAKIYNTFSEDISQTIFELTNSRNEQVRCLFGSIAKIYKAFSEDISHCQIISDLKDSIKDQLRRFISSLPNFPANIFSFFGSVVLLSSILFSGLNYYLFEVDHYFKLTSIPKDSKEITDYKYDFIEARGKRLCPEDSKEFKADKSCHSPQSLVLVATSGGGIQASGWTAQVLAGLQGEIGTDFTKSIGLISSVSGGSVGTMFYLDRFRNGFLDDDPKDKNSVFKNATEDWLASVGWGLAYPDLLRIIGLPWVLDLLHHEKAKYLDRGYALEKDWQEHLSPNITLDHWYKEIKDGDIPIPVFNATLVENGRRFLISPMKFIEGNMTDYLGENSEKRPDSTALDLKTLFNCGTPKEIRQCNLDVTTAARLSASFPYVSPLPRNYIEIKNEDKIENKENEKDNKFQIEYEDSKKKKIVEIVEQNYHIADGGYFDNSGTFTLIEWLNNFLKWNSKGKNINILNIKKVMIVNIDAFPQQQLKDNERGKLGFINVASGPFDALDGVRDATQIARNIRSLELLEDKWITKGVKIENFSIAFPLGKLNQKGEFEKYNQPLSWRLTKQQKQNLEDAWTNDSTIKHTVECMQKFWDGKEPWPPKECSKSSTIKEIANNQLS